MLEEIPEAEPQGGTETVLLVEDEEMMLRLSQAFLERLGYTVFIARLPSAAVSLAEANLGKIDLLITDVVMPQMNGRELAERLASTQPQMKCLYISGYTADIIAHRGVLAIGVN